VTALVTVLHVLACLFLILVVLLQSGKGGGMGIAFGGGGSQTVFGGSGAGNFLTKATAVTACIFMLTSVTLAYFASQQESRRSEVVSKRKKEEEKQKKQREEQLKKQVEGQSAPTAPAPSQSVPGGAAIDLPPETPAEEPAKKPAEKKPPAEKPASKKPAEEAPAQK
jgi:preprotein translocase subunit SecG